MGTQFYTKIYNQDQLIRTLKHKTPDSTGIHRMTWNMDEKGPDQPSRTVKKKKKEQGGIAVKPGTYKIVMEYGDQITETSVMVKSDPPG